MNDYGMRPNRRAKRMAIYLAILVAVMAAAGVALLLYSNKDSRERAIAGSTAAMGGGPAAGPPCDPGTPQGKLGRGDAWKTITFNGVEYGRRVGNVDCGVTKDRSKSGFKAVCRFNAPAELRVMTKDGPHYFDVGLGRPATVIVSDNGVACVRAG
jgi:hypothetical protein